RDIAERYSRYNAFLNVPYDARYEKLFLALIAGLCGFGLRPRATLELPGPNPRLDRIVELIAACHYSFHDLSRVDVRGGVPRFNMPFELGLAVGRTRRRHLKHQWFVFEARPVRLPRSLSHLHRVRPPIPHSPPPHRPAASRARGADQCAGAGGSPADDRGAHGGLSRPSTRSRAHPRGQRGPVRGPRVP